MKTTFKQLNGFTELEQAVQTERGAHYMYKKLRKQEVVGLETVEVVDKMEAVKETVSIEIPRFDSHSVQKHIDNVMYVDFGYTQAPVTKKKAKKNKGLTISKACRIAFNCLATGLACSVIFMFVLYAIVCIGANATAEELMAVVVVGMTPLKLSLAPAALALLAACVKHIQK